MDSSKQCRCCLERSPDKDLKTKYTLFGETEVYADMLKECFEIHLPVENDPDCGICDVCVTRLRDACSFKQQVQRCQKQLKNNCGFKDETKVKLELPEHDENGAYLLDLDDFKEELSDLDGFKDEDDRKLSDIFRFQDVTVKRKTKKKHSSKHSLAHEETKANKKSRLLTGPLKISLRALSQMDKLQHGSRKTKTITIPSLTNTKILTGARVITENRKYIVNLENLLKYSNVTPFQNKTLYGFVCAYCKETYQDPQDLRTHTKETHQNDSLNESKRIDKNNLSFKMDITDLKCNLCNTTFNDIQSLKKHLTKEHDVKFYTDVSDYILEFKLSSDEILNCALCNSTFETFKMLLQHMNGHYRNYICGVCDMGFINKHKLQNHQRTHDVGSFKCAYCDKVFTTRVRKMCHEKYTHNNSARYTTNCPHCDQSFTSYYQRNRHMFKEHNSVAASYKCNICDKSFILKSKLTSHIKKVHLMERNHICPECGQGFFIKQSLDEHMIKHNGERVHKCAVCHKAYARKKTLREHMRIHNNDRRFKCGVCGLAFVQKCSLKSHMLSNHGITLSEYESTRSETDLMSPQVI